MNEWNSLATVPHQETGLIRYVLLFRVVMFFFHSPMSEEEKEASGIIIVKCVKIKGLRQRRDATLPTRSLWYVDETFTVKSSSLKTWPVGYGRLRDASPTTWTRRPIFFSFSFFRCWMEKSHLQFLFLEWWQFGSKPYHRHVFVRDSGVCRADKGTNTYYGRLIGSLESQYHGIRGDVYAVDARTLFIKGFSYDGKGQGKKNGKWRHFVVKYRFNGNVMTRSRQSERLLVFS